MPLQGAATFKGFRCRPKFCQKCGQKISTVNEVENILLGMIIINSIQHVLVKNLLSVLAMSVYYYSSRYISKAASAQQAT